MYEKGGDLTDSPFIQARQWMHHVYCHSKGNTIESAYERQQQIIDLFESIKNGWQDSKIYIWFDNEGRVHLGDGFHRISILHYLNQDILLDCETDWKDRYDGSQHTDFPLTDILLKEAPQGKWTYQPVNDPRVKDWKVDRYDAAQRLEYILKNLRGKRVLDIGCSEGYYARELAKRGYEVTAIDRSAGLIACARYLTTLENLKVDYHCVRDWSEFIQSRYDTILFLAVIHNDMKKIGIEKGIEKLRLLRNKCNVLFMEVPNNNNERGWGKPPYPEYDFHKPESIREIEESLDMAVIDRFDGRRKIYTLDGVNEWVSNFIVEGVCMRQHYKPLFRTLETKPCRNIMEIGVFDGESAVAMIKSAAKLVPEEEIHFYGFDLFEEMTPELRNEEFSFQTNRVPTLEEVRQNLEKTKAHIHLFKGNSRRTLPENLNSLPKMDFIYIDGGHTIETTKSDWQYSQRLTKQDTVVYFDDYCDEMPFIGSYFIKNSLSPQYIAEVQPETDIYPRKFGHLKSQLLKVTQAKPIGPGPCPTGPSGPLGPPGLPDTFRFHLLGLPHAITHKDETMCAFSQLVFRLSKMMTDLGHEVYHYGTEGSELTCAENIEVLSKEIQRKSFEELGFPDWDSRKQLWVHNGTDLAYRTFRKNAIEEIRKRIQPRDMILIPNGSWLAEVGNAFPSNQTIEPIVGYIGYYSKFKVFPSYAWMHHMAGRRCEQRAVSSKTKSENFANGAWYDAVIPHFFDPDEFTFQEKKDDYYLFLGRLIRRKGPHIAADLTKRLGAKLVVAGQPLWTDIPKALSHVGLLHPHVEYLGTAGREERSKLLSNARAVIIPSLYFEPFGLVVAEALLSGTPVITTDWGSFPEICPQGEVGYRCHTMDDFLWAARNIETIDPKRCREYAVNNFSMDRCSKAYQEYFTKVHDLNQGGWYKEHPERDNLDWLKRY